MGPFISILNCVKTYDPLVFHDTDHLSDPKVVEKTPEMKKAIKVLENHVFKPSLWSGHCIFNGNL